MTKLKRYSRRLLAGWLVIASVCVSSAQEDPLPGAPVVLPEVGLGTDVAAAGADDVTPSANVENVRVAPKRLRDHGIVGLDQKVNLSALDAWDVVQLIEFLAYRGGLKNIVIGSGVSGLTTKLKFDEVTVGDALEVVLAVNNLAYTVKGGIVTIMTDGEYRTLYGSSFYDQKEVRISDLKFADPSRVATLLAAVKSSIGTVVADPVTGTLILIDTPEKIAEMEAIVETADISTVSRVLPTETRTFVLQYADVGQMQTEITAILTQEAGAVRSDVRTKTLIVTDLPHKMREVEQMIAMFDRRLKQVFIEAKIVQVQLSDDYRLGINWNHLFEGMNPRFSISSVISPTPISTLGDAAASSMGSMKYNAIVGGGDLSVVLEALKQVGETKILSNPHVAAIDGEEAIIKVITDQPYAEASLESGTTNVVGETIEFIEVGVTLAVTPRISDDDHFISMDIKPEVSSVIGNYQAYRTVPIVRRSMAETSVMIKDAETIIIAGMINNEKRELNHRIPFIGRIPLLGLLFKSRREETLNNELIVFLTPRIVGGDRPYLRMKDMRKKPKPLRSVGAVGAKKFRGLR